MCESSFGFLGSCFFRDSFSSRTCAPADELQLWRYSRCANHDAVSAARKKCDRDAQEAWMVCARLFEKQISKVTAIKECGG
jgi:hypothetical protein